MNEQEKFELIEKYLQGEFNEEEKKAIEQRMAEDPKFWQEVNLHQSLDRFLQNQEEIDLREKIDEISREQPGSSWFSYKSLAIAASISLLVLISFFFMIDKRSTDTKQLFAESFDPYPMVLAQRDEASGSRAYHLAINAYLDQNYQEAIENFEQLIVRDTLVILSKFYQGISYLALNQPDAALENLQEVRASDQEFLHQQALWYMGLGYLLNENQKKALSTLNQLSGYDNYKNEEAQRLTEQLKK